MFFCFLESSVQVKEEIENANADEKPYSSVVVSTRTKRDKAKGLDKKDKLYCAPESVASKKVKNRKSYDANPVFEFNRLCELSAGKSWKRKRKLLSGKVRSRNPFDQINVLKIQKSIWPVNCSKFMCFSSR